jgi:DNA-binding CsgD family transcriptional regulator/DNA-binding transcriptional MerR regulator
MMRAMAAPDAPWMPIGEFARRAGVSAERLRKWESRYAVLKPIRTPGNRRLYSNADLARAKQMARHLSRGVPAAQAAHLSVVAASRDTPQALRAVIEQAAATATNTAFFKTSFVPMLVADDERRYVDVNQAACLLLRLSREDVMRLRIDDLTPPGLRDTTAMLWEAFIRAGTQTGTFELAMPDGARLLVDYSAKANVEAGRHLSLLGFPASSRDPRSTDPGSTRDAAPDVAQLSPREREVLTLIAMGERGASIAATLGVTPATVETHVRNCLSKLGARNRPHAIALGLQRGEIAMRFGSPPT